MSTKNKVSIVQNKRPMDGGYMKSNDAVMMRFFAFLEQRQYEDAIKLLPTRAEIAEFDKVNNLKQEIVKLKDLAEEKRYEELSIQSKRLLWIF